MFKDLKIRMIQARKAKDSKMVTLLSTLIGELQSGAKMVGDDKVVTDEECLAIIRKFIKNINETIQKGGSNEVLEFEKQVLEDLLPAQLSQSEITIIVNEVIKGGASNIGAVMGHLKKNYSGRFDGKIASTIAKHKLGQQS